MSNNGLNKLFFSFSLFRCLCPCSRAVHYTVMIGEACRILYYVGIRASYLCFCNFRSLKHMVFPLRGSIIQFLLTTDTLVLISQRIGFAEMNPSEVELYLQLSARSVCFLIHITSFIIWTQMFITLLANSHTVENVSCDSLRSKSVWLINKPWTNHISLLFN